MTYVLNVFRNLGLSQLKNSNLNPSQEVEYLGAVFNLDFLTLTLPESKVDRIVSFAQDTLLLHQCFRRHLESFIHSWSGWTPTNPVGGCFKGGGPLSSPSGGHLASGVCSPLQLLRAEDQSPVPLALCPLPSGQGGDGHYGQYHDPTCWWNCHAPSRHTASGTRLSWFPNTSAGN